MARIKIECFEKDSLFLIEALRNYCWVGDNSIFGGECNSDCYKCITKNVEFAIKEESNEQRD